MCLVIYLFKFYKSIALLYFCEQLKCTHMYNDASTHAFVALTFTHQNVLHLFCLCIYFQTETGNNETYKVFV